MTAARQSVFVKVMRFRTAWAVSATAEDETRVLEWTKARTRDTALVLAGWAMHDATVQKRIGRANIVMKRTTLVKEKLLLPVLATPAELAGSFDRLGIEASWSGSPIVGEGSFDQSLEHPLGHELRYRSTRTGFVVAIADGPRFWTLERRIYVGPEGHLVKAMHVEDNIIEAVQLFRTAQMVGGAERFGWKIHTGKRDFRVIEGGLSESSETDDLLGA